MSPLETLGFALGTSFASGLNIYATVAAAGLFQRFGLIQLPDNLQVLASPFVLGIAITLFLVEFIAYSAFGQVPEEWKVSAALLAGGVALTSHGAKATTRAAANTSPEPVSNWTLSLAEDSIAIFLSWFAATHPLLTAGLVVVLVILAVLLIWRLFRFFRQIVTRFGRRANAVE